MKKKLFFKFFVFAVIGALVTMTSCKDYDDDISGLETSVTAVKSDLSTLQSSVTSAQSAATAAQSSATDALAKANEALAAANAAGDAEAIAAIEDEIEALQDKIDGINEQLETLAEFETQVEALIAEVETNTGDLAAIKADIQSIMEQLEEMGINLTSLVFIPELYVNGIEAIGFVSLNYVSFCDDVEDDDVLIAPRVLAQYKVNPSKLTEDQIDKENLSFDYRLKENFIGPLMRSAEINPTAKFVSLKDGILTVEVEIDANEAEEIDPEFVNVGETYQFLKEKVDMIALQVPLLDGSLVTSDWARVFVSELYDPFIDRKGTVDPQDDAAYSGHDWSDFNYYPTVEDAKDQEEPYLIKLQYNQVINLVDSLVVSTLTNPTGEVDIEKYGLVYKFDLLDELGEVIEYIVSGNPTDQQDFITLSDGEKGTVTSRVFGQLDSRAAVGRTPIVRVQLLDGDCPVATGFIKIEWVDESINLTAELEKPVNFACEGMEVQSTVQWMNEEIYSALNITKEEFHSRFTLDETGVYNASGVLVPELGEVAEITDTSGGQTTYLFSWTFLTDGETDKVVGYIHYTEAGRAAIKIKVTANVTMPTLSLYGLNTTMWKENRNLYTVNPIVYGNPEAGDDVNIYADILNGFIDEDGKYTNDIYNIIKSSDEDFTPASVKFVFDESKLANYKYFIGNIEYSVAKENLTVSADGLQLLLGDEVAATLEDDQTNGYKLYLDSDGTNATDAAKALIGQRVPVKLATELCAEVEEPIVKTIKSFEVFFIEPIKIDASLSGEFVDAVINGSRISVATALTFTDWNSYAVRATAYTPNPTEKQKYAVELYSYYVIDNIVWDIDAATSNLKKVGDDLVPTAGYNEGDVAELNYQLTYESGTNELVFRNNSGSALAQPFIIYVPVTVEHKWGETTKVVAINVKPAAPVGE